MGRDATYDKFREKHPEYPVGLNSYYLESVTMSSPAIVQNSFCVDLKDKEIINRLLAVKTPEYIYCGTPKLVTALGKAYPKLKPLIKLHSWYEESICFIMRTEELQPRQ